MNKRIGSVGLAAVLAVALGASSTQAQVKIVFNSFAPPNFIINQGMIDVWAKNVERVTEGRVKVEIPATSLAPPQQQWEMVTQGVADGAYIFVGFAQKRLLLPQIATLPFATPTATAQAVALWRTHKKFFEMANEHEGVVFLGYFGSPAAYLWSVDKPFAAVNDLKGVRTWAPPGDQGRALAALGAVIVSGPAVRSYEIISKGIVQAWGGLNFDGSASFNTTQFARAMTIIPGGSGSAMFAVFINKTKWDSIPKRDQDLIMSVSGEEIAKLSKAWDDREAAAYARAKQEGRVQITTASPELVADLKKAWAFLQDEWIANAAKRNVDGRAALKFYFDTVTELSK